MQGMSVMSVQAGQNHKNALRGMLAQGGSCNVRDGDGDRYPLHWAAARGNIDCLLMLLRSGADAEALDAFQRTPAQLAKLMCQEEVRLVLDAWNLDGYVIPHCRPEVDAHRTARAANVDLSPRSDSSLSEESATGIRSDSSLSEAERATGVSDWGE